MLKLSEMEENVDDVLSVYEARLENVGSALGATRLIFGPFQKSIFETREEREKINNQLQDMLARNEHLRKKDFNNMIKHIPAVQDHLEREVQDSLSRYFSEEVVMTRFLRNNLIEFRLALARGEALRISRFQHTIKKILAEQGERKKEISAKLKEFQQEQRAIAEKLGNLLAKGRELRIKDLKETLKEFEEERKVRLAARHRRQEETAERKEEVTEIKQKVAKMLSGFRQERNLDQ